MRFLVFMIPEVYQPKIGKKTDQHFTPDAEMMAKMGKFNEELKKAGALLSLDGLQPLTTGTRLAFAGGKASVTDGPFVEAKEVVGGYAIFEFRNKEEALASAVEFMQLHRQHMPGWEGTCEVRAMWPEHEAGCQVKVDALAGA